MEEAIARLRRHARDDGDPGEWARLAALAAEMAAAGRARDAPVREVFALLGDRWTMLILLILHAGGWRHATLRRIVGTLSDEGAISQRMLTLKLRALERDGFVSRHVSDDVPPRVDYALTTRGRALVDRARGVLDWVRDERTAIEDSRAAFDRRDD